MTRLVSFPITSRRLCSNINSHLLEALFNSEKRSLNKVEARVKGGLIPKDSFVAEAREVFLNYLR
jgi:hypothetical protein